MSDLLVSATAARLQTETTPGPRFEAPKKVARFGEVLQGLVAETDAAHGAAQTKLLQFERGEVRDVHEVMMAMSKSDLSFRLMLEVNGKLLDAYQTVMRMQV